jgi:hypothetical protein
LTGSAARGAATAGRLANIAPIATTAMAIFDLMWNLQSSLVAGKYIVRDSHRQCSCALSQCYDQGVEYGASEILQRKTNAPHIDFLLIRRRADFDGPVTLATTTSEVAYNASAATEAKIRVPSISAPQWLRP